MPFHSLQATSHALQPMQRVESVKKAVTVMRFFRDNIESLQNIFCRAGTPAGEHVTNECFRFHDADIGLFADHQQIIHDVARDISLVSPMIGETHLMNLRPSTKRGLILCVTMTRASMIARGVVIIAHPWCSSPSSPASSGEIR